MESSLSGNSSKTNVTPSGGLLNRDLNNQSDKVPALIESCCHFLPKDFVSGTYQNLKFINEGMNHGPTKTES